MKKPRDVLEVWPRLRPWLARPAVRIVLVLVVVAGALSVAVPVGLRWYGQYWLLANGADSARIEKVRFSPFTGIVGVDGVHITRGGETVFTDSTIFINFGMKNLLSGKALAEVGRIEDVVLDLEKGEDGSLRIASFTLLGNKEDKPEEPPAPAASAQAWMLFAERVDLKNVVIRYRQPNLKVEAVIDTASLQGIGTDPQAKEGSLLLQGRVNGADIRLDLPVVRLVPSLDVRGKVTVRGFALEMLAELLAEAVRPMRGVVAWDGGIRLSAADSGALAVSCDGSLVLKDGDVGGLTWAAKGSADFSGKASFTMDQETMLVEIDGDLHGKNASFAMPRPLINIEASEIGVFGQTSITIGDGVQVGSEARLALAPTSYRSEHFTTGAQQTSWSGAVRVDTGGGNRALSVHTMGKFSSDAPYFQFRAEKGAMDIGNGSLSWDGQVEYLLELGEEGASIVRSDGILLSRDFFYRAADILDFSQEELRFAGKTEVVVANGVEVEYNGSLTSGGNALAVSAMTLGDRQVSWQGEVGYAWHGQKHRLGLHGSLAVADFNLALKQAGIRLQQQALTVQPELRLELAETTTLEGKMGVVGNGLTLLWQRQPLLAVERFVAHGLRGHGDGLAADSFDSHAITVSPSALMPVGVEIPAVSLQEIASADLRSGAAERLLVTQPRVTDRDGGRVLAGLAAIEAEKLRVSRDLGVAVQGIALRDGRFLEGNREPAMATMRRLDVANLSYSQQSGVVCDAVVADTIQAEVKRPQALAGHTRKEATAPQKAAAPQASTAFPVRVGSLEVVGDSRVSFTDGSLVKPFTTVFDIESLTVKDLDLNHPEQPFAYALKGYFDKHSPLEISGKVAPLAATLSLRQELRLKNYSMLNLSPYAVEAVGSFFTSGRLDITSSLLIDGGSLDMQNNLVFKELSLENSDSEATSNFTAQLPVPLSLALTMLTDSDGTINLDVPLSGKLNDLSIGTADLIWTPISKALAVAVTPYLAYTALGPAGALTYLGAKVGARLLSTNLPVLQFEPGEKELSAEHRLLLAQVGETMRQEINEKGEADARWGYSICARVALAEVFAGEGGPVVKQKVLQDPEVRKKLFVLGEARSLVVRDYLVTAAKIDSSRLLLCNPGILFDEQAKPVVEFMR